MPESGALPRALVRELERNARDPEEATRLLEQLAEARLLGDDEAAYHTALELKKEAPRAPAIRELAGLAAFELERWHEAAQELLAYRRLAGTRRRDPTIAECYRRQGRSSRALEFLAPLARNEVDGDTWVRAQTVRARALADGGRRDVAISVLESLREPRVSPTARDEARALLASLRAATG